MTRSALLEKIALLRSASPLSKDHPDIVYLNNCITGPSKMTYRAFVKNRVSLSADAYTEFNNEVFEGQLPGDLEIKWSNRLLTTAGSTRYKGKKCWIELSSKVIDNPLRLRKTLLHEMCHAAQFIVSKDSTGKPHGPIFKHWAARATAIYPELEVKRCHTYEIFKSHIYKCKGCGWDYSSHKKMRDLERRMCPVCESGLVYVGRVNRDGTYAAERKAGPYNQFVKDNFARVRRNCPDLTTSELMSILAAEWKRGKQSSTTAENLTEE